MANSRQPQRHTPPPRRPSPPPLREEDLRDPAEGTPPALREGSEPTLYDAQQEAAAVQQRPTIGVKGEPIEDGERDPDTIAEEQRRRSEDMQRVGIHAWMAARDSRTEEEKRESQLQIADASVVGGGGGPPPKGGDWTPPRQDDLR